MSDLVGVPTALPGIVRRRRCCCGTVADCRMAVLEVDGSISVVGAEGDGKKTA